MTSRKLHPNQRDPVKSSKARITRNYRGVNQGFDSRDIAIAEKVDSGNIAEMQVWSEDTFNPKHNVDTQYYCYICKHFLKIQAKDNYACMNNRCERYLQFINMKQKRPLKLYTVDSAIVSDYTDDEPVIVSLSQEELDNEVVLHSRRTIVSDLGRTKKIRWYGYPKVDLESNS